MKKRKSLMQNMQKWSYLNLGHCNRGQLTVTSWKESSAYIRYEGLKLLPRFPMIYTCSLNSVLKQHQRARTRQSREVQSTHQQKCLWHLKCHDETKWQDCQWSTQWRATGFSHSPNTPEASCLFIPLLVVILLKVGTHIGYNTSHNIYKLDGEVAKTS